MNVSAFVSVYICIHIQSQCCKRSYRQCYGLPCVYGVIVCLLQCDRGAACSRALRPPPHSQTPAYQAPNFSETTWFHISGKITWCYTFGLSDLESAVKGSQGKLWVDPGASAMGSRHSHGVVRSQASDQGKCPRWPPGTRWWLEAVPLKGKLMEQRAEGKQEDGCANNPMYVC